MKQSPQVALIDDDRLWLDTLGDFLERRGLHVLTAALGSDGLALLQDNPVGLALVDYHMPDMSGLELLDRLQQRGQATPVLLMSSDSEPALVRRALAAGARGFLPKSAPPTLLLDTIKRCLAEITIHLPVLRRAGAGLPVVWQEWTLRWRKN